MPIANRLVLKDHSATLGEAVASVDNTGQLAQKNPCPFLSFAGTGSGEAEAGLIVSEPTRCGTAGSAKFGHDSV